MIYIPKAGRVLSSTLASFAPVPVKWTFVFLPRAMDALASLVRGARTGCKKKPASKGDTLGRLLPSRVSLAHPFFLVLIIFCASLFTATPPADVV